MCLRWTLLFCSAFTILSIAASCIIINKLDNDDIDFHDYNACKEFRYMRVVSRYINAAKSWLMISAFFVILFNIGVLLLLCLTLDDNYKIAVLTNLLLVFSIISFIVFMITLFSNKGFWPVHPDLSGCGVSWWYHNYTILLSTTTWLTLFTWSTLSVSVLISSAIIWKPSRRFFDSLPSYTMECGCFKPV